MLEKSKNGFTKICLIVAMIADILAISAYVKVRDKSAIATVVILLLLLAIILFIFFAYIERKTFIEFIEYLFSNNIQSSNVLPKVCLKLDKTKEYNNLEINKFVVKYTYDFSKIDCGDLSPNSRIEYIDSIEYKITAKNKHIPQEFAFHLGNESAVDEKVKIMQKHGSQANYEEVPPPRYENDEYISASAQKYCWQIKQEHITNSNIFPIQFLIEYNENSKANSSDVIELYPKQYAKSINELIFQVDICCSKNVLADVKVFKVWKDKKTFKHTPISGVKKSNNTASITIEPNCDKYEAYYLKVYWKLV